MKKTSIILMFVALTVWHVYGVNVGLTEAEKNITNGWGAVRFNTQISIAFTPTNEITTNQNVDLLVRIKNLSTNEDCNVYLAAAFLATPGLSFIMISPSGKDLSTKPPQNPLGGSGRMRWLRPGQIGGFHVGLNEFLKINELGTYTISLKLERWSRKERKTYDVISNPLSLRVVP